MNSQEAGGPPTAWHGAGTRMPCTDVHVFVRTEGDLAAKTPIVLLHGFPTSSHDFVHVWPRLARRFPIVALDFVGFGWSDKPKWFGYGLHEQADVVLEVLQKLAIRRAHVVAHDMGTSVATELVARKVRGLLPIELASLTLSNGSVFVEMAHLVPAQQMLRVPAFGDAFARLANYPMFRRSMRHLFAEPESVEESELKLMWELLVRGGGAKRMAQAISYVEQRKTYARRWIGALERHVGPSLLLWGAKDPVAVLPIAERLAKTIRGSRLRVLHDLGHYPHVEGPDAFAHELLAFLDDVEGSLRPEQEPERRDAQREHAEREEHDHEIARSPPGLLLLLRGSASLRHLGDRRVGARFRGLRRRLVRRRRFVRRARRGHVLVVAHLLVGAPLDLGKRVGDGVLVDEDVLAEVEDLADPPRRVLADLEAALAEEGAVLRAQIADEERVALPHDLEVTPRGVGLVEEEIAAVTASEDVRLGGARDAEGFPLVGAFGADDARVRRLAHRRECTLHEGERELLRLLRSARLRRGVEADLEPHAADADEISVAEDARCLRAETHAADEGAVGAALVDEQPAAAVLADRRVPWAHARIRQAHVARVAPSDDDARRVEGERRRIALGRIPADHDANGHLDASCPMERAAAKFEATRPRIWPFSGARRTRCRVKGETDRLRRILR